MSTAPPKTAPDTAPPPAQPADLPGSPAERPHTEMLVEVSSAALAADRQQLQEAERQRIDHERQQALARERELARFD
ncbi:MAG: hypothetical protein ACKOEO_18360 [Planctomycetaceae bacterium]